MFKKMMHGVLVLALSSLSQLSNANLAANIQLADTANFSVYLSQIIHPTAFRNYKNVDELNRVSSWLKVQMQKFGIPCDFQNYTVRAENYRNVVCKLNVGAAKSFIVGAHYDVHGKSNGADDNASGVTGVIETARILSKEKSRLKHNVEFVFYTLQEAPYFRTEHMGSAVHVSRMQKEKDQIEGVMILEMIGYFDTQNTQEYPAGLKYFYPAHGNFIAALSNFDSNALGSAYCNAMAQNKRLDCQRLVTPSFITAMNFSDHWNYWDNDIPAILITDTALFRNKNYHTASDKVATLNLDKMKHVIDGVVLTIINSE